MSNDVVDHADTSTNLCLQQVENNDWGPAASDATTFVRRVHELRRIPLSELTLDDVRLLISQDIGLDHVVPRALTALAEEPLLETTYYPGDLLAAVLRRPIDYWRANPSLLDEVEDVLNKIDDPPSEIADELPAFAAKTRLARVEPS